MVKRSKQFGGGGMMKGGAVTTRSKKRKPAARKTSAQQVRSNRNMLKAMRLYGLIAGIGNAQMRKQLIHQLNKAQVDAIRTFIRKLLGSRMNLPSGVMRKLRLYDKVLKMLASNTRWQDRKRIIEQNQEGGFLPLLATLGVPLIKKFLF